MGLVPNDTLFSLPFTTCTAGPSRNSTVQLETLPSPPPTKSETTPSSNRCTRTERMRKLVSTFWVASSESEGTARRWTVLSVQRASEAMGMPEMMLSERQAISLGRVVRL